MSSLNRITLIGEVASAPDVKATSSGDSYLKLTLAVDRPARPDVPASKDYIPVVAWRELAEIGNQLSENDQLLVDGRIVTRSFDTEDGKRKWVTEVEAKEIKQLGGVSAVPRQAPASAPAAVPSLEPKRVTLDESDFDFGMSAAKSDFDDMSDGNEIPF